MDHVIPLRLMVLPEARPVELAKPAVLVGRHSDVELRLAYPDVSRRHCRLVYADGVWQVQDLDSLNGLFVNGERMHEATLYEGDHIRVGEATLVITEAPVTPAADRRRDALQPR
jgi:pSer/pThr/pTyr-binding forkhead associated (FHA) protein